MGLLLLPQTELQAIALVIHLLPFYLLLFLLQVHKKKEKNNFYIFPSIRIRVSFQSRCKDVFLVVLLPRKNDFVVRTHPQE